MNSENSRKEPALFYGWIILGACFCTTTMLGGMFYSFGVFFKPLIADFGWTRALTSSVHTVYLLCFAVGTIVFGRLTDIYGPRSVLTGGAVLIGLGFGLSSRISSIVHLCLCYAVLGIGAGATWSLPTATIQRWFLKRRGLTLGIVTAGVGFGTLVFTPIVSFIIETYSWRTCYVIMGVIGWSVSTIAASLLVADPAQKGLKPYGVDDLSTEKPKDESVLKKESDRQSKVSTVEVWTLGEAVKTRAFYALCFIYLFTVIPICILAVHTVPYATDVGISKTLAAAALGVIGGISIAGRIIMGASAEKIGWKNALAVCCFICAAAAVWLISVKNAWMLYVYVLVYGFFYGGKVPQLPGLAAYFFGTEILASVIGITHAIAIASGAGAPILAGYIFDKTKSYFIPFLIAALSFAIAAIMSLMVKQPKKIKPIS